MLADPSIQRLLRRLDDDPKLAGAGVIFIDKNRYSVQIRPFTPSCRIQPIHLLLHETPPTERTIDYAVKLRTSERESRVIAESVGALLSCSAAVLGWVVVFGSAGVAPVTGGTSAAITVLTYFGSSCELGAMRCGINQNCF